MSKKRRPHYIATGVQIKRDLAEQGKVLVRPNGGHRKTKTLSKEKDGPSLPKKGERRIENDSKDY